METFFEPGAPYPDLTIVGPLYSGKTSVADYLVERHGYTRLSFAGPLKEACVNMLNAGRFRPAPFTVDEINVNKGVFRTFLQWVGSDLAREYLRQPTYWVDQAERMIEQTKGPLVFDDMRFLNEAKMLHQLGFRTVKVHRLEDQRKRFFLTQQPTADAVANEAAWAEVMNHSSETTLSAILDRYPADAVVFNTASQDELYPRVDAVMGLLLWTT